MELLQLDILRCHSDTQGSVHILELSVHLDVTCDVQRLQDTSREPAPALRISRKKGSFLKPPHVRDFVKEGYFFLPRYEENPLTIHEMSAALTTSDSRNDWAFESAVATATAKQAENYNIKS